MKNIIKFKNVALVIIPFGALILSGCGNSSKKGSSPDTQNQIESENGQAETALAPVSFENPQALEVFNEYLNLKNALIADDVSSAQESGTRLAVLFEEKHPELEEKANKISASVDLTEQRKLLSELTSPLESIFKGTLTKGTIYKQFCPMAFNNSGAYWLSDSEQIRNPYYGDMMLKCGMVKETIQ